MCKLFRRDPMAKAGRKSDYTEDMADYICDRIANGASMRGLCAEQNMPDRNTVLRWLNERPDFAAKYARAREAQADYMDDQILDVANNSTNETANADRVKILAYQWRAAKLAPKRYGDRLDIRNDSTLRVVSENPVTIELAKSEWENEYSGGLLIEHTAQ